PTSFSNLTFSTTSNGTATTTFPYGTQDVYARWDFSNVPAGAVMKREWYRNNVKYIEREEAWQTAWGSSGTLSHIHSYDTTTQAGLGAGTYRVVVYLRDFPTVRLEGTFVIEGNLGPKLSNLRFASSANGTPSTQFNAGTQEVFAIFDYSTIPLQAQVRRVWRLNGNVIADRTEVWDFNKYGTNG